MTDNLGSLTPDASKELARQIEDLAPNIAALAAQGFAFGLANVLASAIKTGAPDIGELQANGVDMRTAVQICSAIHARHSRIAAAMAKASEWSPVPPPDPPKPPSDDDVHGALWQLAELSDMIARGEACPTKLSWAGYSAVASKELADLIRLAHRKN